MDDQKLTKQDTASAEQLIKVVPLAEEAKSILVDTDSVQEINADLEDLDIISNILDEILTFVVDKSGEESQNSIIVEKNEEIKSDNKKQQEDKENTIHKVEEQVKIKTDTDEVDSEEFQISCPARKRLKMELEPSKTVKDKNGKRKSEESQSSRSQVIPDSGTCNQDELAKLKASVKAKEEQLRQLNLLQFYEKQHSLEELTVLVDNWRQVAQNVASDLYKQQQSNTYEELSIEDFLRKLDVDPAMIGFE